MLDLQAFLRDFSDKHGHTLHLGVATQVPCVRLGSQFCSWIIKILITNVHHRLNWEQNLYFISVYIKELQEKNISSTKCCLCI